MMKRATLSLSILVVGGITAVGCGSSSSNVGVTTLPVGGTCANGGVQVTQPGKPTQIICNGAGGTNGTNTLVVTTTLTPGDTHCISGGVKIESGLDNGAGGGTSANGKLEPGEVVSTQYVCNGDTGIRLGSLTPPDGGAGTNVLRAVGGPGTDPTGTGGNGGGVRIGFNNGSFGGNLKVFRTGTANANFTFPAVPAGDLGATPAVFNTNTEVSVQASSPPSPALAVGTVFLFGVGGGATLKVQDTPTSAKPVTGLSIKAGVTVIFDTNETGIVAGDIADVEINGSCRNAGTITAKGSDPANSASLKLFCKDYFGDNGSAVSTVGAPGNAVTAGGNGGFIDLEALAGSALNHGNLLSAGGNGSVGGTGGFSFIFSEYPLYNTGNLTSRGGNALAATSAGGNADYAELASTGSIYNSGNLDSSGGNGTSSGGSAGQNLLFAADTGGPGAVAVGGVLNSGNLTANGGNVDPACSGGTCASGSGNQVEVFATGGPLTQTGAVSTKGGNSSAGVGGSGGSVSLHTRDNHTYNNVVSVSGDLTLSASIDSSGGSGKTGGSAGDIDIKADPYNAPAGQEIILYGFPSIHTEGANGGASGGSGGLIFMYQNENYRNNQGPGGAVVNYADLSTFGGDAAAGTGGTAGGVDLETQSSDFLPGVQTEGVVNAGMVSANGGKGTNGGGDANYVYFYGRTGVTNSGNIASRAGNATILGAGGSHFGNEIDFVSDNGPVSNSGNADASGGDGAGAGASGGSAFAAITSTRAGIFLAGLGVNNSGSLSVNGGKGDSVSGTAGSGGSVQLFSLSGLSTNTAAAPAGISVKPGPVGFTPGTRGLVIIDGRLATLDWAH